MSLSPRTASLDASTQTGLDHDVPDTPQLLLCAYCLSRLHDTNACPMALPLFQPRSIEAQLEVDYDFLKVKTDRLTHELNLLCARINALEFWMKGIQNTLNSTWLRMQNAESTGAVSIQEHESESASSHDLSELVATFPLPSQ